MENRPNDSFDDSAPHSPLHSGLPGDPPEDAPPETTWWLWALLGLFVIGFMGLAAAQQKALQEQQRPQLTQSVGDLTDDPQLRLSARYALGVVRLAKMSGDVPPQAEPGQEEPSQDSPSGQGEIPSELGEMLADLMDGVDQSAETLVEQVRAVPVAAELRGHPAALQRLEDLSSSLPTADDLYQESPDTRPGPDDPEGLIGEDFSASLEELQQDLASLRLIYQQGADALSEEERQLLLDRHLWYARLALQQGGDKTVSVDAQIWRTTLALIAAGLAVLLAGLAGFVLLVAAILQYARGHLRLHYRVLRARTLRRPLLEVIVLFLPVLLILTLGAELLGYLLGAPPLTAFILWGALLAPMWPLVRGASRDQLKQALGWHRGRGTAWEILSGIAGYLAGLPILATGLFLTFLLSQLFDAQPTHPAALEALTGSTWQVIQIFLLACVWAPVVEESVFRGALFSHLRFRHSALASAAISGLIFAAIHPQGLAAVPVLGSIGIVLALIREWRGSLIASMTAHAINNFVALSLVLLLMR